MFCRKKIKKIISFVLRRKTFIWNFGFLVWEQRRLWNEPILGLGLLASLRFMQQQKTSKLEKSVLTTSKTQLLE